VLEAGGERKTVSEGGTGALEGADIGARIMENLLGRGKDVNAHCW
jgi:hypothetical protein